MGPPDLSMLWKIPLMSLWILMSALSEIVMRMVISYSRQQVDLKMPIMETGQGMQPTTIDEGKFVPSPPSFRPPLQSNNSWAEEQLAGMDAVVLGNHMQFQTDLLEKLAKMQVKNEECIENLRQSDLRELIPTLLRYVLPCCQAIKKTIYEQPPKDWPSNVPFKDPCNAGCNERKPSKDENIQMAIQLYRKYLDKCHAEEAEATALQVEFGEERCTAVTDLGLQKIDKPVLIKETCKKIDEVVNPINLKKIQQALIDLKVRGTDDLAQLSMKHLRTLMPLLVKALFWPDGTERGIYKMDKKAIKWPDDIFLDDPNNGEKPSQAELVKTMKKLYEYYEKMMPGETSVSHVQLKRKADHIAIDIENCTEQGFDAGEEYEASHSPPMKKLKPPDPGQRKTDI